MLPSPVGACWAAWRGLLAPGDLRGARLAAPCAEFALQLGQLVVDGRLARELLELAVDVVFAGAELR